MEISKKTLGFVTFIAYAMAFGLTVNGLTSIIYADMIAAYPNVNTLIVEQVVTVTSLISTFVVLGTGLISAVVKKKTLAIIGLGAEVLAGAIFLLLGGKAPIAFLLVASVLLGLGHGIITTTYISIIPQFFDGEERAKRLGQQITCSTIGGIVIPLVAGKLAAIKWTYAYFVVIIQLIILIIVVLYMPALPAEGKQYENDENKAKWYQIPKQVWITLIWVFVFFVGYIGYRTNLSVFIKTYQIGTVALVGTLSSVLSIGASLMGLCFGKIFKKLKGFTFIVAFVLVICALGVYVFSHTVIACYIGSFVLGLGLVLMNPSANTICTSICSPNQKTLIVSLILCVTTGAGYVQTFILSGIANIIGDGSVQYKFIACIILMIVAGICSLFTTVRYYNNTLKVKE